MITPSLDFAAALANPIAYQSALEKHAEQLAVLEQDDSEAMVYRRSHLMYSMISLLTNVNYIYMLCFKYNS